MISADHEAALIALLEAGSHPAEISRQLGIAPATVKKSRCIMVPSMKDDLAREASIRRGSDQLGQALRSAGYYV